jgi:GH15 family glucan-1,4-alpha-glucosidase
VLSIPAGGQHDLVLELSTHPLDDAPPRPDELWRATDFGWQDAAPPLVTGAAQRDAIFAHAVLRGLTRPGGGMVAAATTTLPERALAGRNYDYRYAWIRDQSFAGQAAALAGQYDLLDDAVAFLTARVLADGTGSRRPTPPPAGRFPNRPTWTFWSVIRAHRYGSATGSAASSNWMRSARFCSCWQRPPGTAG